MPLSPPLAESSAAPLLQVRDLTVQFQGAAAPAVQQVSLDLLPGQTLAIVGESGSGKSVTCLAMMGLIPQPPGEIVSGEIWFRDRHAPDPSQSEFIDLLACPPAQLRRYRGSQMAMIFQEPMTALNPVQSCGAQIIEAILTHEAISATAARRRTLSLLREVKLLPSDDALAEGFRQTWASRQPPSAQDLHRAIRHHRRALLRRYPHELSGGQLQRMMIAMALACNPSLLIADEPTTALDVTVQASILRQLRELRDRRNMAMVFISHDLSVVAEVADKIAVMYRGRIVESGPASRIFQRPQHPYTKGLLACRPQLQQRFRQLPTVADFMEERLGETGLMEIREKPINLAQFLAKPVEVPGPSLPITQAPAPAEVLLSVRDLRVSYPVKGPLGGTSQRVKAVDGVSFEILTGETLGLVGESGCGKSTLARALLGLIKPTGGQVLFGGQDLAQQSAGQLRRLRRDMQIIFQDPNSALDPRMKVGMAIAEPLRIHRLPKQQGSYRPQVAQLLQRVDLPADAMARYPHEFSGGQRQRICIARALALNPKFIICDESVSALDVSVQAQVLNLLKDLQRRLGLTYLFISHDLSVVKFMSDRMIVMNQGRIEEMGDAAAVYANPQQDYTKTLIASIPQVQSYLEMA
ncbi:MAG: ABC transporter ATP-binding protein [Synechococcales cyanobacterium RM1_1_8]|nr:ABC transporter ATP-binding protein [Synechococcales cyanobacterium RM1_1_8]